MKVSGLWLTVITVFLFVPDSGFCRKETETIRKTLKFARPGQAGEVIVDNINGSIRVTGYDGEQVELVANKTIFAGSQAKIERAKEEIRLQITEQDNTIELFVDAPYRCEDGSVNYRGWRHYGYEVTYDFELKVPRNCDIFLKTINEGEIKVQGVRGDYDLHNINGGIRFIGAAGSGRVYALNGDVTVEFSSNPKQDSFFGSLNGEIDVTFLPGLNADFRVKTFNGDLFTDFDVEYLSPRQSMGRRKNGKFVYQADKSFGVRVGKGGPEFVFDSFNGDIHVVQK